MNCKHTREYRISKELAGLLRPNPASLDYSYDPQVPRPQIDGRLDPVMLRDIGDLFYRLATAREDLGR